jgi:hypothetical protein
MDRVPSSPFVRRVADLDDAALRAFVADVWRARGRTVADAGDALRVDGTGDGGRTVAVVAGSPVDADADADADVVVTGQVGGAASADADATLVDPADLRRLLLYAVDRSSAAAVCDAHLGGVRPEPDADPAGRPPDAPARGSPPWRGTGGPPAAAGEGPGAGPASDPGSVAPGVDDPGRHRDGTEAGDGGDDGWRGAPRCRVALAALVVAVGALVVGAAVAPAVPGPVGVGGSGAAVDGGPATATPQGSNGAESGDGGPGRSTDDSGDRTTGDGNGAAIPSPEAELREAAAAGGSSVAVGGPAAAGLPPGVAPDGTVDEATLAAAHAAVLANTSYRATLTHRERVDGVPAGLRRETIDVASPTRFAVDVEAYGSLVAGSMAVAEDPSYAVDGNRTVLVRPNETYTYGVASPARGGPIAARLARLVEWFLSVGESRLAYATSRDGRRYYALAFANDTYPGVENATGTAIVDERGVVHELRRSYGYPTRNGVRVTVTVRLSGLNRTTADPPPWYERLSAVNRSAVDRPRWYDRPTHGRTVAGASASASAAAGTATG